MNKETFIRRIALIQNFHSEQDTLQALIDKMTDGHSVVDFGNSLVSEIIDLINEKMQIEDKDLIGWWLYEDVEKLVYDCDDNVIADLKTASDLYDYIMEMKKC